MRLSTEFESWGLLVYYVSIWLIGVDSFKLKLSAISFRESVYLEQWEYKGS